MFSTPATDAFGGAAAIAKPFRNAGKSRTLSGTAATNAPIAAATTNDARATRELSSL